MVNLQLVLVVLVKLVPQIKSPTHQLATVPIVQLVPNQMLPEMVVDCVMQDISLQKTQFVNCALLVLSLKQDLALAWLVDVV